MKIYNSLSRQIEKFVPINPPNVGMYSCGPTVYWNQHIGHLRRYVGDDILRRALELNGYKVTQVMNITDVGHLTSDADEGEDKMEKGARKLGKTVWEVAALYEKQFFDSLDRLNIVRPNIVCRATEHIEDQIALITKLEEKGYAYKTDSGVYFDVSKFENYTKLSGQKLADLLVKAREDVVVDTQKKNPADFALWVLTIGIHQNHTMRWESPWGTGFPGWHIECSAMSMKYLGETIDIHTGGIDHIPIHHTNEIAQSEAATGKQFVHYWIHNEFLLIDGKKMSKSLGNLFTIEDIEKKSIDPLALRYLYLTAHYRDPLNFSWKSLEASQNALNKLASQVSNFKSQKDRTALSKEKNSKIQFYSHKFFNAVNDDLKVPRALATVWEVVKSNIPDYDKYDLIVSFDEVLGLGLARALADKQFPKEVKLLLEERDKLRQEGKFREADEVRIKIHDLGFKTEDTPSGFGVKKL
ncbi:MAG: cysteine--tRNA ligase [Patescibacteria group bacterium]